MKSANEINRPTPAIELTDSKFDWKIWFLNFKISAKELLGELKVIYKSFINLLNCIQQFAYQYWYANGSLF